MTSEGLGGDQGQGAGLLGSVKSAFKLEVLFLSVFRFEAANLLTGRSAAGRARGTSRRCMVRRLARKVGSAGTITPRKIPVWVCGVQLAVLGEATSFGRGERLVRMANCFNLLPLL